MRKSGESFDSRLAECRLLRRMFRCTVRNMRRRRGSVISSKTRKWDPEHLRIFGVSSNRTTPSELELPNLSSHHCIFAITLSPYDSCASHIQALQTAAPTIDSVNLDGSSTLFSLQNDAATTAADSLHSSCSVLDTASQLEPSLRYHLLANYTATPCKSHKLAGRDAAVSSSTKAAASPFATQHQSFGSVCC
ncbi:hypothetical protein PHSY_002710 [Pseudozyma hubeiensis SY62]|uniref:Uncharacterized protein n=1 Tax=Pseudozyma hubeiensis (strain SY62) TaxID=1305764 RepID=R9PAL1_PSEHS|nr:hypothetical protein PHSY_002710 [Pseudozyma hubeiensis SY62]GAC95135.1 hypothetical protein PHSY_002710 [Pseudozyma hubeiensis SY62]